MAPPDPAPKGHRIPESYDGSVPEDFPQWVERFQINAKANNWGEGNDLLGIIPIYLKDHAFNLFSTLAETEKDTYANLITNMRKSLGIGENTLSWSLQLRNTMKLTSESMDAFAFRLSKIVAQAYPEDNAAAQERSVREQFILGQKPELANYLLLDKTGTLSELKDKAKRFVAARELSGVSKGVHSVDSESTEISTSAINAINTETDPSNDAVLKAALNLISSGNYSNNWGAAGMGSLQRPMVNNRKCYNCNKPGHIASQCRSRNQNNGTNNACYLCGQIGHFKRDCPRANFIKPTQVPSSQGGNRVTCFRCNNTGHQANECRTNISKSCTYCQKKGHLTINCRQKPNRSNFEGATNTSHDVSSKNDVTQAENGPTWG